MTKSVTILAGPAGSGKTDRLLGLYRDGFAREDARPGGLAAEQLWLAPTQRSKLQVVQALLEHDWPGCLRPQVLTFDQFAEQVIRSAQQLVEPLGNLAKRRLVRQLVAELHAQGDLKYFGPIADQPGLIDLLIECIRELKRLEIWPEHLSTASQRGGVTDKDREILTVYQRYQERLQQNNLYDREGRFWWARSLLQDEPHPVHDRYRLVVVDGFADFTRTQNEILDELVRRSSETWVSLPLEQETLRADLFAKSQDTLAKLQQRHERHRPQVVWSHRANERRVPAALERVQQWLFVDPQNAPVPTGGQGIELLVAAQAHQEIAAVGRRVKQLLVAGTPASADRPARPEEIVVVYRNLDEVAPLVRESFTRLGIPFSLEARQNLGQSAALRNLTAWLRLGIEDWPYRSLLAVTGSGFYRPVVLAQRDEAARRRAVEMVIRQAGLPRGSTALVERTRRLAQRPIDPPADATADDETAAARARRIASAQLALPVLEALASLLQSLPQRATLGEWQTALKQLARKGGLLAAAEALAANGKEHELSDSAALERLWNVLDELEQHDAILTGGALLDRRQMLQTLEEILRCEQLPTSPSEAGRVCVLSAASVRALRVPYVFLAGLTERSFPQPEREDRLYGEADARRLAEAGLPMVTRAERSQEELLLFYEVLTRATQHLYLSYPALDSKAQTLLPSPLLTEVQRLFGATLPVTRLDDLSPVPAHGDVWSPGDWQLAAMSAALHGDADDLPRALGADSASDLKASVTSGLRVLHERARDEQFGPYEGMLSGKVARQAMAQKFGPAHAWSASQLEAYSACPFRFLISQVLRLEPPPDLELAVDYGRRGRLIHATLAAVHRQLNAAHSRPASPQQWSADELAQRLVEQLALEVEALGEESPLTAALIEVDRRWAQRSTANYYEQHREYDSKVEEFDEALRPAHFEVSFGTAELGDDPRSTTEALELGAGDERVLITGRIDRIDVGKWREQTVFNLLDYKSSNTVPTEKDVSAGQALQLPLYALAVERLILAAERAAVYQAGYWQIRVEGFKPLKPFGAYAGADFSPTDAWRETQMAVIDRVLSLARGARAAQFPVFSSDNKCTSHCDFKTVCRVHQARSLEKLWQPPAP